jgi:hypothetical protein
VSMSRMAASLPGGGGADLEASDALAGPNGPADRVIMMAESAERLHETSHPSQRAFKLGVRVPREGRHPGPIEVPPPPGRG